jgi:hypothetical protein
MRGPHLKGSFHLSGFMVRRPQSLQRCQGWRFYSLSSANKKDSEDHNHCASQRRPSSHVPHPTRHCCDATVAASYTNAPSPGRSSSPVEATRSDAHTMQALSLVTDDEGAAARVVSAPTVLLDMDQTLLVALPLTSPYRSTQDLTLSQTHLSNNGKCTDAAVVTTREGFTVLRGVPWVRRQTPQQYQERAPSARGFNAFVALLDADLVERGEHRSHGVSSPPPSSLVDVVVRPHVLHFLRILEKRGDVQWRICTANHPRNALNVLRVLRPYIARQSSDDTMAVDGAEWGLNRLALSTYHPREPHSLSSSSSLLSCTISQMSPTDGHCTNAERAVPKKELSCLFVPCPRPAPHCGDATLVPRDYVQMRPASFTNALLFDDSCNVFDADDLFVHRRCIPVPPFGSRMKWCAPLAADDEIERASSSLSLVVVGASSADISDSFFAVRSGEALGGVDKAEMVEEGLAKQLIDAVLATNGMTAPTSLGDCGAPLPTVNALHESLWLEACGDFWAELECVASQAEDDNETHRLCFRV